ncbi:MAG TPA: cob(I)yrinic acid a,c-diamide adenosyltransferase, partial [Candidatus Peribacteraceae bacterium]|nr:cob(I)yrinic acid a,c-diamide adenosyltransferase [Candidatus Peribacteraceae bacterium]
LVLAETDVPDTLRTQLNEIQRLLFTLGADLATPMDGSTALPSASLRAGTTGNRAKVKRMGKREIEILEQWGERHEKNLPQLTHFILPRGPRTACLLHQARTVCRRAERWLVELQKTEAINEAALVWLNRLSDYLFLAARLACKHAGVEEVIWVPN